ncbi:MAG: DNA-directed RNA polymerase subunit beta [candidate division TM6 bacterium GW2011_GWF2_32_72]|nr:MAG: DNA-directed RNA polymerase subunit beta [candidate division TM6 bacterium GW2011_GWF2_32_72]
MANLQTGKGVIRKSFSHIKDVVPVPNLIEIQSKSFNDFVQLDCLPEERSVLGLEKVLRDIFPIEHSEKISLEYVSYELGNWSCTCGRLTGIRNRYSWTCSSCKKSECSRLEKGMICPDCKNDTARYKRCSNCLSRVVVHMPMTLNECRSSEQTYSMPLKIKVQLLNWDITESGEKIIRDIKEQDIFFADVPVMADLYEEKGQFKVGSQGTFLINGVDRVIVSQLHRSPGAIFSQSKKVKDYRGKSYYISRIIPMRGSWLDFEFDSNDYLYVRIDKKKKILATTFLQALGVPKDEIISLFYDFETVSMEKGNFFRSVDEKLIGARIELGMVPDSLKSLLGKKVTKATLDILKKENLKKLPLKESFLLNKVLRSDVVDPETGEILLDQGQVITEDNLAVFKQLKKCDFDIVASSGYVLKPTMAVTLSQDKCNSQDEALKELHTKVWPGDSSVINDIQERLDNMLFNSRFYDLTKVGRIRMNRKLGLNISEDQTALTKEDIFATIRYLVNLRERGEGELDDIDHLGNRRVRLVGELLSNQVYLAFLRIERIVRERLRIQETHSALMPQDFLNVKPLAVVLREFFGTCQLSQFLDQTNPLSEVAHKRRLSALGPGGVMKDRATYEIRDVHTSHYGRICPIETPEGQTVGLISSLATYAMVNDLGFIETAYRVVKDEAIQDQVVFLDAFEEADKYIAQVDAIDYKSGKLKSDKVLARHDANFVHTTANKIRYIDLSPKQLVSVSTALIPFLEHDDAVRALMGSNMQRQAVPLIRSEVPLVGTGMEKEIVKSSCAVVTAKRKGIVEYVSSDKIIIRCDEDEFVNTDDWVANGVDTYYLRKFQRSSYSTLIHQSPIVKVGERVDAGDILTDGSSIKDGELALGSNLRVAFMAWHGYNFEDAIIISKRLVADDALTSIHIEEFDVDARETKLGPEEITRDIPNAGDTALAGLDEDGIVKIGTRVRPGDILVGKVTMKGDIQYSPEEKLLRAIFGEKSIDVRDTSLRVPPGIEGTVVDIKVFSRSGIRKDRRYKDVVIKETSKLESDAKLHKACLEKMLKEKIANLLEESKPKGLAKLFKGATIDQSKFAEMSLEEVVELKIDDVKIKKQIQDMMESYQTQLRILEGLKEERINRLKKGDPLPSGVIKMVKVYIAMKRTISVGDKIAGRHGNKGVVSNIVPREDMPYLKDGSPVDIVLNPLGVPSRMNVGQILETALGFVGTTYGQKLKEIIKEGSVKAIKDSLVKYYGQELIDSYEKMHGSECLIELAKRASQEGVCFETPVFDGASFEGNIRPMMKDLGLPETGSFDLYDGRTGLKFYQPVTVGTMYILKLIHMVDDKLHARSVGPYSLVTQQPMGGKALMGGQRLGEMEVWALEAYGAAYTLQEMLTYKSDDVSGRHKVYEAIVRGENVPDPGLPESFNVLIKELQSLGLSVDLFKTGKEKVSE